MTHTAALHARAAAHSLGDALTALRRTAAAEAAHIACEGLYAADGLRSTTYGVRYGSGGHSDPTATTYLTAGEPFRVNRSRALLDDISEQLHRLAQPLPPLPAFAAPTITGTGDIRWEAQTRDTPLDRIHAAIPNQRPDTAARLADALTRLDEVARRHLKLPPAREPLTGQPCRCCGQRRLEATTAGPVAERVVVCAACNAVWPRDTVIGAVAGAAPAATAKEA
ncbi:hypothetical protein ABZ793_12115 [Micromonospora sp. NPDC047465]|uniref:hypothetical protein n=1 Tax=Micromonospora sp. NPDC047465 TaxID=3154813 RepID=UPI0033F6F6C2